eukprot:NODE_642_length_1737_cov_36.018634_g632_i0.p1 GENE.NODE_642_length_1737_cov_36.018634_g632_i0~~NODE_642_length_1737_cov_36.018634_g632_i0.p1  ORF type:complete len:428 (+),score=63.93 NODE_642_length_1737_cov_36.018634_g632_i0:158-1285(+)
MVAVTPYSPNAAHAPHSPSYGSALPGYDDRSGSAVKPRGDAQARTVSPQPPPLQTVGQSPYSNFYRSPADALTGPSVYGGRQEGQGRQVVSSHGPRHGGLVLGSEPAAGVNDGDPVSTYRSPYKPAGVPPAAAPAQRWDTPWIHGERQAYQQQPGSGGGEPIPPPVPPGMGLSQSGPLIAGRNPAPTPVYTAAQATYGGNPYPPGHGGGSAAFDRPLYESAPQAGFAVPTDVVSYSNPTGRSGALAASAPGRTRPTYSADRSLYPPEVPALPPREAQQGAFYQPSRVQRAAPGYSPPATYVQPTHTVAYQPAAVPSAGPSLHHPPAMQAMPPTVRANLPQPAYAAIQQAQHAVGAAPPTVTLPPNTYVFVGPGHR